MEVFWVSPPSVQHAKETDLVAAEVLGVLQQCFDDLAAGVEDRVVASFLVGAQQRTQFLWNGKRDDKMLHRQQLGGLFGQPGLGFVFLAVGAVAIAARSRYPMLFFTTPTLVFGVSQLAGLASHDQTQHLAVSQRHRVAVLGQVRGAMLTQGIGNSGHLTLLPVLAWSKQLVDDLAIVLFGDFGQVQINHRRLQAGVAEVFLDGFEADVGFEQVRGERMSERVARNFFAEV